jgi:hypothetical protein
MKRIKKDTTTQHCGSHDQALLSTQGAHLRHIPQNWGVKGLLGDMGMGADLNTTAPPGRSLWLTPRKHQNLSTGCYLAICFDEEVVQESKRLKFQVIASNPLGFGMIMRIFKVQSKTPRVKIN